MNNFSCYLAGGMQNLSMSQQLEWRNKAEEFFKKVECNYKVLTTNPPKKYNFFESKHRSEREVMEYDLYKVRNSDLVLVNFNDERSIGTSMELMLAKELHIPVIGINDRKVNLHPWLLESCTRICYSLDEALEHIKDFYLN